MKRNSNRQGVRLGFLWCALCVGLGLIAGRLYWLQIVAADRFTQLAQVQRQRRVVLSPQRGSILDRTGADLAISMDKATLFANPRFVSDAAATARAIAPILESHEVDLYEKLSRPAGFVYLARKIDPAQAARIEALNLPGIDVAPESQRLYPLGPLAAHVLGFVGFENKGLGGLEQKYDRLLKGSPGEILTESDPQGRPIPMGRSYLKPPEPGRDLVLTIDRQIQFAAESSLAQAVEAYRAKGGSAVVMDPRTGAILALANLPTFDPNLVRKSTQVERRNKAVEDVYEPGSSNKVVTAAAAMETGVTGPAKVFSVPSNLRVGSKVFKDSHPHPTLQLSFGDIIQQSSNVGTIKVALDLGKERLYDYLTKFGYGSRTGLELPGEASGILPKPDKWWGSAIGTIPIGQGVAATPVQVMKVFAAIANAGISVEPRLVSAMIDSEGARKPVPASQPKRVISAQTARDLSSMLIGVTEAADGTGRAAAIPGYQVGGKTGTAQKPSSSGYSGYVGSFYGYAPAADPRLVVGVVLDEPIPIYGGLTAANTFREIMQFSLRRLGIGPGPVLPSEGTPLPAPARSGGAAPSD